MVANSEDILVMSDTTTSDTVAQNIEENLVQECVKVCKVEQQAIEDVFVATEMQKMLLAWHLRIVYAR